MTEEQKLVQKLAALQESGVQISTPTQVDYYADEPLYFQYACTVETPYGIQHIAGTSFRKENAFRKCLFEAVERAALAQEPSLTRVLEASDLEPFPVLEMEAVGAIQPGSRLRCELARAKSGQEVFIPCQLVRVPYSFLEGEPVLREPISTGAAAHSSPDAAFVNGLLESIERHCIMHSYYRQEGISRIPTPELWGDDPLVESMEEIKRCGLSASFFNISKEPFSCLCVLCFVFDETGHEPCFTAGAKAGFDLPHLCLGSLEEALHSRIWHRDLVAEASSERRELIAQHPEAISDFDDRALLWSAHSSRAGLEAFESAEELSVDFCLGHKDSPAERRNALLPSVAEGGYDWFSVEFPPVCGVHVKKVVVPKLAPLFIDEKLAVKPSPRQTDWPHFFL